MPSSPSCCYYYYYYYYYYGKWKKLNAESENVPGSLCAGALDYIINRRRKFRHRTFYGTDRMSFIEFDVCASSFPRIGFIFVIVKALGLSSSKSMITTCSSAMEVQFGYYLGHNSILLGWKLSQVAFRSAS